MPECAVPGCKEKNRAVFCTPYLHREKRDIWFKQIGVNAKNPKEPIYVCESHFEKRHVTDYDKKRLSVTAIPTLNLPERSGAKELDEEVKELEKKMNASRIVRNPDRLTVLLHHCQSRIKKVSTKPDVFKELSIRIYLNNPNAYKSLLSTLNLLPVNEIYKSLSSQLQSSERDKLFQRLIKFKTNVMTEDQKECYISVEEIHLEPYYYYNIPRDCILGIHNVGGFVKPQQATTAIILTLHGISGKWKQCACVGFVSEDFKDSNVWQWIEQATEAILTRLEFNVQAIIYRADAKYPNRGKSYFLLSNNIIHFMCEASSLLRVLYYNWMTKGYCYEKKFPSKQYLIDYMNLASNASLQISPKLSYEDLNPPSLEEVDITRVKKVFCHETAAALFMFVEKGELDKSAEVTANFIIDTVNLINSLNPKVLDSKKLPWNKINSASTQYLQIALKKFSNLKYSNEAYKNSAKRQHDDFVEQIDITINSILLLHQSNELSDRSPIPSLPRINFCHYNYDYGHFQSTVDKVLSEKKHLKRSAKTIDLIFRQVMTRDFLKPYNKNALVDVENTLIYIQNCFTYLVMDSNDKTEISKLPRGDYKKIKIGKVNSVHDLCTALLERASSIHEQCKDLNRFMVEWNTYKYSIHNIIIQNFMDFVLEMENSFKNTIEKSEIYIHDGKFVKTLINVFQTIEEPHNPCKCFPTEYVKNLYIRFRIYHMLKKTNTILKTTPSNSLELEL